MINKGIGEAIVTLNENGFVGRYIENIELLEDAMVLKGSRYWHISILYLKSLAVVFKNC